MPKRVGAIVAVLMLGGWLSLVWVFRERPPEWPMIPTGTIAAVISPDGGDVPLSLSREEVSLRNGALVEVRGDPIDGEGERRVLVHPVNRIDQTGRIQRRYLRPR